LDYKTGLILPEPQNPRVFYRARRGQDFSATCAPLKPFTIQRTIHGKILSAPGTTYHKDFFGSIEFIN
jgi:hypothetical protein